MNLPTAQHLGFPNTGGGACSADKTQTEAVAALNEFPATERLGGAYAQSCKALFHPETGNLTFLLFKDYYFFEPTKHTRQGRRLPRRCHPPSIPFPVCLRSMPTQAWRWLLRSVLPYTEQLIPLSCVILCLIRSGKAENSNFWIPSVPLTSRKRPSDWSQKEKSFPLII